MSSDANERRNGKGGVSAPEAVIGTRLGALFHVERSPTLSTTGFQAAGLSVTDICAPDPIIEVTTPLPAEDASLLCVLVSDMIDHQIWEDGRPLPRRTMPAGEFSLRDLRRQPVALIDQPHHCIFYHFPHDAFRELADAADATLPGELRYNPGQSIADPVIRALTDSLHSALTRPEQANRLFVEHVLRAVAAHVLATYGGMKPRGRRPVGTLASWQERRAKEILSGNLDGNVSLEEIARECRLSISQLSRGFKRSVGVAPHQWLVRQRVQKAKVRLADHVTPLSDIALSCGFADQSHFTRVFMQHTGMTPAAWRRAI